jgi:NADPH-dependent stearoyl-CoA 9-desaturase
VQRVLKAGSESLSLAADLQQIRAEAKGRLGPDDVAHLRKVHSVAVATEVMGRALLHFGLGPVSFLLAIVCLWVGKQLQNAEIGHTAAHGVYDRFPEARAFHRKRFVWRAPVHEESWIRSHNSVHHPHTSVAGVDPDHHFGPIRLSHLTKWRRYHVLNLPLLLVVHCFHMSLTTLYYANLLDRVWPSGDFGGKELRKESGLGGRAVWKLAKHTCWEYGFFTLIAGPAALRVFAGNWISSRLRDIFTSLSILVNHVGSGLETYSAGARVVDQSDWYRRQVECTQNLVLPTWLSILTGGLDCHIEHHLFPELPPNRLREISASVEMLCREHQVSYVKRRWPAAILSAWAQVARLSSPDRSVVKPSCVP